MGDLTPWLIIGVLVVGMGVLGLFISSGPSWEIRRKANEYKHTAVPGTEDYIREFINKGPSKAQGEDWEKLEGNDEKKGRF